MKQGVRLEDRGTAGGLDAEGNGLRELLVLNR